MNKNYWVIGAEFADSSFETIITGTEQLFGPFASYDEAKVKWAERAWRTVDNCHARYRIAKTVETA